MEEPHDTFRHGIYMHNLVNQRLGKPEYNYDQALRQYRFTNQEMRYAVDRYAAVMIKYMKKGKIYRQDMRDLLKFLDSFL